MIALAHILLGILIGKSMSNLFLIALLAFASHFILDAIPHLDPGSFKHKDKFTKRDWNFVALDLVIGLAFFVYFAFKWQFWPIAFGAFFAILPDIIDNGAWLFKWQRKPFFKQFNTFHERTAFKLTRDFIWLGIILEVAIVLVLLSVLFFV